MEKLLSNKTKRDTAQKFSKKTAPVVVLEPEDVENTPIVSSESEEDFISNLPKYVVNLKFRPITTKRNPLVSEFFYHLLDHQYSNIKEMLVNKEDFNKLLDDYNTLYNLNKEKVEATTKYKESPFNFLKNFELMKNYYFKDFRHAVIPYNDLSLLFEAINFLVFEYQHFGLPLFKTERFKNSDDWVLISEGGKLRSIKKDN